uniref:THAP domain-containing protein 2-like n=1 Tax=Styela clava TaxID=7725 RepID=UPI00193A6234|nr:THAP domain-containing protein 2-like [Styela clava]
MGTCSALNCNNRSDGKPLSDGTKVRMFRFPADPVRRKKWLINMRRRHFAPRKYSALCQVHFEITQFELRRADGKKKLKLNAVPTIFDHTGSSTYTAEKPRIRSSSKQLKTDLRDPDYVKIKRRLSRRKTARKQKKESMEVETPIVKLEPVPDDGALPVSDASKNNLNVQTLELVEILDTGIHKQSSICENCELLKNENISLTNDSEVLKKENETLNTENGKLKNEVSVLQKQLMFLDLALKEYLNEEQQKLFHVIAKTVEYEWEDD